MNFFVIDMTRALPVRAWLPQWPRYDVHAARARTWNLEACNTCLISSVSHCIKRRLSYHSLCFNISCVRALLLLLQFRQLCCVVEHYRHRARIAEARFVKGRRRRRPRDTRIKHQTTFTKQKMAGFFRRIYDWLLRLFW